MKSTFLVLALAVFCSAGCRAMGPKCGQSCGPACGNSCGQQCCEPCHAQTAKHAPRPEGCGDSCGHGNLETGCPGGGCCVFDRYCGSDCGPGYPNGVYDCSPCGSPRWGCTGHGHPFGYKTGHECYCSNDGCGQNCVCPQCGRGYCGGGPGVGCQCLCPYCGCGPSGDHNYNFNPGPPTAQTAYPYYTLRGPRDFLMGNPPSIGPY